MKIIASYTQFLLAMASLIAISCNNDVKMKDSASHPIAAVQDTLQKLTQENKQENVALFPRNVQILIPTQYRKESTGYPKNVKGKEWYELYKDAKSGKWVIGKADLKISYGRDECVGEDVMIVKSKHEDAVLFFTPFASLSENPVTALEDKMLFPEHNVSFSFNGKNYRLSPMGSCLDEKGQMMTADELKSKTGEELDNNTKISGYRLAFGNEGNTHELVMVESIEFATPRLIWAGDLNNDGLPDLILNIPDFYESQHLFFFLSDPTDAQHPFKKIADLKVTNDC